LNIDNKMILYTFSKNTAYIAKDIQMLEALHPVKAIPFTDEAIKLPFYFILQFFQLLYYVPTTSHYFCNLGGYHSLLPVMFGRTFNKKVYVQCGGVDAVNMPQLHYGNYRKRLLRESTIYSFKNCTRILPVSLSLINEEYNYSSIVPQLQGLRNLIPYLETPIQVIPKGFDNTFWTDLGTHRPAQSFLTIATGISYRNRAIVKGIDLLLQLAEETPSATFTIIGDSRFKTALPNVKVIGELPAEKLLEEFNKHQFYLQLSMAEGFPDALAEAMLCGCIPIGSAVGPIPEIIGDTGFVLEKKDTNLLLLLVEKAIASNVEALRILAPFRIKTHFNYEDRKKALLALFN